ncbi:unnamed protein product [Heterobilharzia americana]|nr:unnamed protein product [Heterobilharzia americana]
MKLLTSINRYLLLWQVVYYLQILTCNGLMDLQTVYVPELPKYIQKTELNGTVTEGLLVDLLSGDNPLQVNYSIQSFPSHITSPLVHVNHCTDLLSTSVDCLCLFEYTSDALINITNSDSQGLKRFPYVTRSFTQLRPVLLAKCDKNKCSSQVDSWFINAMYFVYAFHSSIWSLILLYALTTGSLLFFFEYSRPASQRYTKVSPSNEPGLNLLDSYLYTFRGLFLQSFNKLPRSWSGMTLTLFWHGFCLLCIIAYVMGTSVLIFKQYTNNNIKYKPYSKFNENQTIYCDLDPKLCEYFDTKFQYPVEWSSVQLTSKIFNESVILLTDHINAHYIKSFKLQTNDWNFITLDCNVEVDVGDTSGNNNDRRLFNDMPVMELGFLTFSQKSLLQMNAYLKVHKEQILISRFNQRAVGQKIHPVQQYYFLLGVQ